MNQDVTIQHLGNRIAGRDEIGEGTKEKKRHDKSSFLRDIRNGPQVGSRKKRKGNATPEKNRTRLENTKEHNDRG